MTLTEIGFIVGFIIGFVVVPLVRNRRNRG